MNSSEPISDQTIAYIDRLHDFDGVKNKLRHAWIMHEPVALTHEEARLILANLRSDGEIE